MRGGSRWRAIAALSLSAGCEWIGGVDFDAVRGRDAGVGRDAGGDAQPDLDAETSSDAGGPDSAPPVCEPGTPPDDAIFVSDDDGSDEDGDGSASLPFATIGRAITTANAAGARFILLEEGSYGESIVIPDTPSGLTIEGGWQGTGDSWVRNCDEGVVGRTVIAGGSVAVTAERTLHTSGLRLLTVRTRARGASNPDSPGETVIGVLVRGDGAVFSLTDVDVSAGSGGDGGPASQGETGEEGEAGACAFGGCSSGEPGAAGRSPGQPAATSGIFTVSGFVAADGEPGETAGDRGQNGTNPAVAPSRATGCYEGCECNGSCQRRGELLDVLGAAGRCGCGGGGGSPGSQGRGGGASVGLMVIGDGATVVVTRGVLESGRGGDGSDGAPGGDGGQGSDGTAGGESTCVRGCCTGGGPCENCYSCDQESVPGGSEGGPGGAGGQGSPGGAGAGGSSFAIVRVGGAHTSLDGTVLAHGNAGTGGDPDGARAPGGEADREHDAP